MKLRSMTICALSVMLGVALAGCGEIAFKRGAGPDDFNRDRKSCRQMPADDGAYARCLADKGWLTTLPDSDDPVAHATYAPDNRGPGGAAFKNVPSAGPQDGNPMAGDGTATPPLPTKPPPRPTDVFRISSWWKAGSSEAALKQDLAACVASLGEAHQPPPDLRQATRGLLLCMRKAGWYGLEAR